VYQRPQDFIPAITAAPERYGRYEALQAYNALYIYAGEVLTNRLDLHELAAMNHALRQVVGASIRYFAVDTRLFPLDGENTGIFYAPAKLSDHRIVTLQDGRSVPRDFFDVMATTQRGVINVVDVRDTDQISDLTLRYKDMFYNSMFYRAYIGYAPRDVGLTCSDCIPGLPSPTNQSIANFPPMQAWNLSHFRLVYKTAYYNPFPPEELANHTDAWQAMDFPEAQELQGKINRGEATGVVDLSPASTIRRGIVFLKYYDGAFVNGTVTLGGFPWPNVRVTVHDEFGIPHYTTLTDEQGRYSVLVPFGEVRLLFSLGTPDSRTLRGPTILRELTLTVSDAAAMRENVDADGDGMVDWLIARDVAIPGEALEGILYVDLDRDAIVDAVEPLLAGAELTMARTDLPLIRSVRVASDGRFRVEGLYPGSYNVTIRWQGRTIDLTNVPIGPSQGPGDLPIAPTNLRGFALDLEEAVVAGATVTLRDLANGTSFRATADREGAFAFRGLLSGDFELQASAAGQESLPARLSIAPDATEAVRNVTLYPVATVSLRTTIGGTPQPFVTVAFTQRSSAHLVRIVTTDRVGEAHLALPEGTWDAHARHFSGDLLWAFVGSLTVRAGDAVAYPVDLVRGAIVRGAVFDAGNRSFFLDNAEIVFRSVAGEYRVRSDSVGRYIAHLPLGTWTAQVSQFDLAFVATRTIAGDVTFDLAVPRGATVGGTVVRTLLGNATASEAVSDATLRFRSGALEFVAMSDAGGAFSLAMPTQGSFALEVTRLGFEPLTLPARPAAQWQVDNRIAMVATNVTATGTLRLDGMAFTDSTLPVLFLARDGGAVTTPATLDGTGRYTVALQPGRYEASAERNETQAGDVRLELRAPLSLPVSVGAGPIARDIDLVRRYRIDGTVSLSGDPRTTPVRFEGPDDVETEATDGLFAAFLAAGTYTLTANTTEGPDQFLALQRLDVSAPATLSVSLLRATELRGAVRHEDVPIESATGTFARAEGGTVRVTTDDRGEYRTFVLGGTYTVTVDHRTTVQRGAGVLYVRFTFAGSLTIPQDSGFQLFNVDVVRSLDNTTVSGTVRFRGNPVSAQLAFRVSGANGIDTTSSTTSGSYALPIQPGEYDVYAVAPLEGAAFLGRLDVSPDGRTFDIDLRPSVRVSGATTLRGTRTAATLSFTSPTGRATIATDASGIYQLHLPPANYGIEATASGTERGTAVNYRGTANVTIESSTLLNVAVTKVVRLGVGIEWDAAQRTEVRPGGTVVYSVTLRNTGNEDDTYLLTTIATGFTLDFEEDDVSIPFGTTGNVRTVRVTITAHGDARVDHAPISVTARSLTDGSVTRSVNLALDVTRFRGLSATVSSDAPTWDGRFLNYSIEVRNTGNAPETIRLSLPNADELRAAGWRAVLSGPSGSGETIDIGMGANSTLKPILRLEKAGGRAGTLARVNVVNTADPTLETLLTVNVQMPVLAVEGDVRAIGPGITVVEPGIDLATAAFLVSLAAVVAAAAYLAILRRRSR
ncbi:MAG: carboxypeptidase regulatory-like domain-containing protein, partial [Euryarchaeota archaeon]|nr:carboxypeptidase regulatory-like domain-containing protein [Euryarchaeota archaeon]